MGASCASSQCNCSQWTDTQTTYNTVENKSLASIQGIDTIAGLEVGSRYSVNHLVSPKTGEREIHIAVRDENIYLLRFLIDNDSDLDLQTSDTKDTALHIASRMNSRTMSVNYNYNCT